MKMNNIAIKVEQLSKMYKLYDKPMDRLKESLGLKKKILYHEHYALNNISFEIKMGETKHEL
jgi:teichoic acid transport system ATP-binding protein